MFSMNGKYYCDNCATDHFMPILEKKTITCCDYCGREEPCTDLSNKEINITDEKTLKSGK